MPNTTWEPIIQSHSELQNYSVPMHMNVHNIQFKKAQEQHFLPCSFALRGALPILPI